MLLVTCAIFKIHNDVYMQDVCTMYPCGEGELCQRRGGVTCVGSCEAEDLRTCGKWGVSFVTSSLMDTSFMQ